MKGHLLTVLQGSEPAKLPLEVVSVIPLKGAVGHSVLVRLLAEGMGVAQGMSGSPVYIQGRLAGAVGAGWNFSDHNMALVTPIEDMCRVFDWPDQPLSLKRPLLGSFDLAPRSAPLSLSGLDGRALPALERALGVSVVPSRLTASGELRVREGGAALSPGDALAVLLAWGDVELASTGTVTATSKDGRFLAFAHPFLSRGAVNFPAARAWVHATIDSREFPFKLASPMELVGTVTQDRAAGIGGRLGAFVPAISAELSFRDSDTGRRSTRRFRVVPDPFLSPKLLTGLYQGLLDDEWGRRGQGSFIVTLRVDGRGLENGWARTNVFFSETDASVAALQEAAQTMEMLLLQPFRDVAPAGFRLDVTATEEPRVLYIEDISVPDTVRPGDELDVEVTLRPWRRRPVKKSFRLTMPDDATGACELLVRGGSVTPLPQLALEGGWKSVQDFKTFLRELSASDANNELILELLCDPDALKSPKSDDKRQMAGLLQEEREFLSETKSRRIKAGTLQVSRTEYFVDGFMKRLITIKNED